MERKNTVLLTVIAVATLLVAVVGATFAYFTATASSNGTTGAVNATTANGAESGAYLSVAKGLEKSEMDYPGGYTIAGLNITGKKADASDANDYKITFDLTGTVNLGDIDPSTSNFHYAIYRVDDTPTSGFGSNICTVNSHAGEGVDNESSDYKWPTTETRTWYTNCAITNLNTAIGGTRISAAGDNTHSDWIKAVSTNADASGNYTVNVSGVELVVNAATVNSYFYLVLSYENKESAAQNSDMNKTVTVQLAVTGTIATAYNS